MESEGQWREVEAENEKEKEAMEVEVEVEEEEEVALVERWRPQRYSTFTTTNDTGLSLKNSGGVESLLIERGAFGEINVEVDDIIINKSTPVVNPSPSKKSLEEQYANGTYINTGTSEHGSEVRETEELYLETLYKKPDKHAFYCPNCKACIDKVLIHSTDEELIIRSREDYELRCPSCFEFLKPIGNWIFRKPVSPNSGIYKIPSDDSKPTKDKQVIVVPPPPQPSSSGIYKIPSNEAKLTKGEQVIVVPLPPPSSSGIYEIPSNEAKLTKVEQVIIVPPPPSSSGIYENPFDEANPTKGEQVLVVPSPPPSSSGIYEIPSNEAKPTKGEQVIVVPPPPPSSSGIYEIPSNEANSTKGEQVILVPPPPPPPTPSQQGAIKYEILRSIVYGGLIESITSLGVVTSAASANAAALNILALALANLIGGLFILGHNLKELKNDQVASNETKEQVDRYQEVLGQKRNFVLHASVAISSFIVFGLVPPVVYGFSFYESNNRDLKLAVVAAASLSCITLLAIVKAYNQKPSKWNIYIKTILYYLGIGIGTSGISYLAGYLVRKLIEKLGWFESSVAITMTQPLSEKPAWESY